MKVFAITGTEYCGSTVLMMILAGAEKAFATRF